MKYRTGLICGSVFLAISAPLAAQNPNALQTMIDVLAEIQRQKAAEAARKANSTANPPAPAVPRPSAPPPRFYPPLVTDADSQVANEWFGFGTNVLQSTQECGSIAARQAKLGRDAVGFRQAARVLERVGQAFTTATAFVQARQGHLIAANQTVYEAVLDQHICEFLFKTRTPAGAAMCAGWTAGRTIGSFIEKLPSGRYAPDGTSLSIDDLWTDTVAGAWLTLKAKYGDRPLTEHNYQLLIQAARQEAQEATARRTHLEGLRSVCRRAESPNEVDRIVERAQPRPPVSTATQDGPPAPSPPLPSLATSAPAALPPASPPPNSPAPVLPPASDRAPDVPPSLPTTHNPEVRCSSPCRP